MLLLTRAAVKLKPSYRSPKPQSPLTSDQRRSSARRKMPPTRKASLGTQKGGQV